MKDKTKKKKYDSAWVKSTNLQPRIWNRDNFIEKNKNNHEGESLIPNVEG
jgi:hypothetical protein